MVDVIVVGLGLAGIAVCEQLRSQGKSFVVFNDGSQTASRAAGGLMNPVILKRFNLSWRANEQLPIARNFYENVQQYLGTDLFKGLTVLRRFASIEEQNLWFQAADKSELASFLLSKVHQNKNPNIKAPAGFGQVLQTYRLQTELMLEKYAEVLLMNGQLKKGTFRYTELKWQKGSVAYDKIQARTIIFTDGFGLKKNPFFRYLPLQGSKGEYLIIKSEGLRESSAIKSSIFMIPLGNDMYKVGANYNREDKTNEPTKEARKTLEEQLQGLITCPYRILDQVAGVRPTVKDRRPLVGMHPEYQNLWLLNGLGSHGITIAPWAAKQLFAAMDDNVPLPAEIDIRRFEKDGQD
jgi:glycine/D-amino acid oxidase-like deaminating enzyme